MKQLVDNVFTKEELLGIFTKRLCHEDGINTNSNNYSCGNHFFKVLVQIHYSQCLVELTRIFGILCLTIISSRKSIFFANWFIVLIYQNIGFNTLKRKNNGISFNNWVLHTLGRVLHIWWLKDRFYTRW